MKKLSYKEKYEITRFILCLIVFIASWGAIILNYFKKVGIINVC